MHSDDASGDAPFHALEKIRNFRIRDCAAPSNDDNDDDDYYDDFRFEILKAVVTDITVSCNAALRGLVYVY
jgi:hypothetical protein